MGLGKTSPLVGDRHLPFYSKRTIQIPNGFAGNRKIKKEKNLGVFWLVSLGWGFFAQLQGLNGLAQCIR